MDKSDLEFDDFHNHILISKVILVVFRHVCRIHNIFYHRLSWVWAALYDIMKIIIRYKSELFAYFHVSSDSKIFYSVHTNENEIKYQHPLLIIRFNKIDYFIDRFLPNFLKWLSFIWDDNIVSSWKLNTIKWIKMYVRIICFWNNWHELTYWKKPKFFEYDWKNERNAVFKKLTNKHVLDKTQRKF